MISIAAPYIGPEEEEAVMRVLRSGQLAAGPEVAAFEGEFAEAMGAKHAVAVTNGTVAIEVALRSLGIGQGDEVIVPAFTFIATANAVVNVGARPVFADIDPDTFCLEPDAAAAAVTPATRAVMPVHLYGHPVDLAAFDGLGGRQDIAVVGDAAQAHGATLDGRAIGGDGACNTWSLYPTKNMTSGEGGMISTDDEELAGLARSIANHGRAASELGVYDHHRVGGNSRMMDLCAAIGRVQLGRLSDWLEARRGNAAALHAGLRNSGLVLPDMHPGHAWHQFTIRSEQRDALREHLAQQGVGSAVYYPKALCDYGHFSASGAALPESRRAAEEVLSLPIHPGLSEDEVQAVVDAVNGFPTPA